MIGPWSPYSRGTKFSEPDNSAPHVGDETEWDEARCPICMEHPHNAVLLLCSSHEKGCRPFICDTSYRHSNCLDQFLKVAGLLCSQCLPAEHQSKLACPLCRGTVMGWKVVHPARRFMDSKTRSCSLETCSFSGNYLDLRRHARTTHPSKRPSDPSPTRQSNWAVIEQQSGDALAYHSTIDYWDYLLDYHSTIGYWDYLLDYHSNLDRSIAEQQLTDGINLDFESEVPDLDDSLIETAFLGSLSLYNLYSPSPFADDLLNSGGSINSDGYLGPPSSNSGPSLHNQVENTFPSHPSEDGQHATSHKQEDDLEDVSSGPTHRIENSPEHSHLRENNLNILRPSNYRGGRENNLDILRPSNHRENAPSSSRRRSSYYHREQHTWYGSRSRQSYYYDRRDDAPEQHMQSGSRSRHSYYYERRDDTPSRRHIFGSSSGPHSRYYNDGGRHRSGQASARNITGPSRQARWRHYESSSRDARGPSSYTRPISRHYSSSSSRY